MLFIDPENAPGFKRTLFNAIVAPRPIGWISTMSPEGQVNLAPFSHFNLVSTAPPVVMFSCNAPADRHEKDTITNVRATGEFVTNLVTWELRDLMNISSLDAPYGTDEFELAGLEGRQALLRRGIGELDLVRRAEHGDGKRLAVVDEETLPLAVVARCEEARRGADADLDCTALLDLVQRRAGIGHA